MARASPPLAVAAPERETPIQQRSPLQRRPRLTWAAAVLLGVLVLAVAVWLAGDDAPPPPTRAEVDRAVQNGVERAQLEERNRPPDAAAAYNAIVPSLVTITVPGADGTVLGTGVVINAQGAVLTALHVVDGPGTIQVRFADGTRARGRVVERDPGHDIAVLAVDRLPEVVVPAVMGGGAQVGDAVFPVGHPLGLRRSLSAGVVSATDRAIRTDERTLEGLIQFDAAVNPGNSGGPLLNRGGQVIGIVTGLANPSKQSYFVGIGFAVPIGTASGVAGGPRQ